MYNLGNLFTAGAGARNFLTARDWRFAPHDERHVAAWRRCTPALRACRAPPSPGRPRLPLPAPPTGSELGSRKPPTTPHKVTAGLCVGQNALVLHLVRALAEPQRARAAARSPVVKRKGRSRAGGVEYFKQRERGVESDDHTRSRTPYVRQSDDQFWGLKPSNGFVQSIVT